MLTSFVIGTTTRGTTDTSTRTTTHRHAPARTRATLASGAIVALLVTVFAVFAGRDAWTTFPILLGACGVFVLADADVFHDREARRIDLPLVAGLALLAGQLVPLPASVLQTLTPHAAAVQDAYAIVPFDAWRPLTVHPAATRTALSLALAGALTFWAARTAFSHGGRRHALLVLAWLGCAGAVVSMAQRVTAPGTLLWIRRLPDPRAMPFGPFVDSNQLATWLLLVIVTVAGVLLMDTVHERVDDTRTWRDAVRALSRGAAPGLIVCLVLMLATLAATLSRSGLAGLLVAVVCVPAFGRTSARRGVPLALGVIALLVGLALFVNAEGLAARVSDTLSSTSTGRLSIWKDALVMVRDFPLVGTGAGTFADVMLLYQRTNREVLFNHAHDEYLQLLSEGGVTLIAIVVVGLVGLARVARTRLRDDHGPDRWMRVSACAALAGLAAQSVWETGLRAPANLLLAATIAGVAVAAPRPRRQRHHQ